jgi:hypothetical protein
LDSSAENAENHGVSVVVLSCVGWGEYLAITALKLV